MRVAVLATGKLVINIAIAFTYTSTKYTPI